MKKSHLFLIATILIVIGAVAASAASQAPSGAAFDPALVKSLAFRNLGPFRAGSWVTSFAVPTVPARDHLYTLYVGTRNGGVWKTVNAGTTFEPVFDAQPKLSIGDVAVAPSDARIVWVGTGEAYCARSSNPGDGIYKSTDAGKTWVNMGLRDSQHIARVVIHPTDPDIVYAAVMGPLFALDVRDGRAGERRLQNDRRRQDLVPPGGIARRDDRPHRARCLSEESVHSLCRDRECESPGGHGP
ncbi:MAG: hypothetical protein ABSA30_11960 [Candidatus Aminicenantales bacterium]